MSRIIFNANTGEIERELMLGDRILTKSQSEYISNTIELNNEIPFVKCFINKDLTVANELTGAEHQILSYLYNFISYNSQILAHENGKILNIEHISDVFNVSEDRIRKIMKSLVDKKILGKHRTGHEITYIMNPFIFQKGTRISKDIVKLFKDTKWAKRFN